MAKKEQKKEEQSGKMEPEHFIEKEEASMGIGESWGEIKISNEVVVTISSIAASKIDGVHCSGGKTIFGKKDIERGITASVEGNTAIINVEVKVDFGKNIYDTVQKLQKQIKDAVEQMTGLEVEKVNVTVKGIIMPEMAEEYQPASEEEQE